MRTILAVMLSLSLSAPLVSEAAVPDPIPCRLKVSVAIGCQGDEFSGPKNAANAFGAYGLSGQRISADYTKDYLNQFGCIRVFQRKGNIDMSEITHVKVPTPDGYVDVRWINARVAGTERLFWIASPYFNGPCKHRTMAQIQQEDEGGAVEASAPSHG